MGYTSLTRDDVNKMLWLEIKLCKECEDDFDGDYDYCPYCGNELESE